MHLRKYSLICNRGLNVHKGPTQAVEVATVKLLDAVLWRLLVVTLMSYSRLRCMNAASYTRKKFAHGSRTATVSFPEKYFI